MKGCVVVTQQGVRRDFCSVLFFFITGNTIWLPVFVHNLLCFLKLLHKNHITCGQAHRCPLLSAKLLFVARQQKKSFLVGVGWWASNTAPLWETISELKLRVLWRKQLSSECLDTLQEYYACCKLPQLFVEEDLHFNLKKALSSHLSYLCRQTSNRTGLLEVLEALLLLGRAPLIRIIELNTSVAFSYLM